MLSVNPLMKKPDFMNKIKSLTILTSRRQMLLAGFAAFTLAAISKTAPAKETRPLKTRNGHSQTKLHTPKAKRILMIDPGHGGVDPGAIGGRGTKEKHVVLAIAKTLHGLLVKHGYQVMMTRESDIFIPLYQRVEIAHQHNAELFMSIHADGFTHPQAAGASVFALSNRGASSAMAKYLANRENSADEVAGGKFKTGDEHYLQQVVFDLVQTNTIKNSLTLGSKILKKITPVHRLHSNTTEQAAFVVLKSPSIPSVLVETSFITNPHEEKLLETPSFQRTIATAISDGVVNYFSWFDHQKTHARR